MNDNLWKFVTDAFEFIGGGAVFAASLLYLLVSFGVTPLNQDSVKELASLSSTLLALIGVTVAYVVGVVAESASRGALEWDLNRLTVRHSSFDKWEKNKKKQDVGIVRVELPDSVTTSIDEENEPAEPEGSATTGEVAHFYNDHVRYRYLGSDAKGEPFSGQRLKQAVDRRERRRLKVAQLLPQSDIDSQLKRLRLERMIFLSGLVTTAGAGVGWAHGESPVPAVVSLVLAYVLFRLVHVRFRRYLNAIARSYKLLPDST